MPDEMIKAPNGLPKKALKKKSMSSYVVALALFVSGIGYMAWSGFSDSGVYFLNVSEALAMPAEELKAARLFGTVADGEITRPDGGLGVRFRLQDAEQNSQIVWVDYKGAVPDTFEVGAEVIVEGRMGASQFEAKSLMTKCPSKYEKQNRTEV